MNLGYSNIDWRALGKSSAIADQVVEGDADNFKSESKAKWCVSALNY